MEVLYSKLYDKYAKLKTKKLSEFDQLNKDQEVKFINCLSAAEELIEHLRSENDQLRGQVNDLRSEMASTRLAKDKQVADYQRLLVEENKKNEALSEEVEKFRMLHQDGTSSDLKNNSNDRPEDDQLRSISNSSSRRMTRKRSRHDALKKEFSFVSCRNNEDNSVGRESTQNLCMETASGTLLKCFTKANDLSGIGLQENGHSNWLIQALLEYALGMKLSTDYQTGRTCISALHQLSGYSFSITWISKGPGEEAELLYHVQSLGTFERVAPEWMREDIMFSTTMWPIFFERVSRVIKLHH